MNFEYKELSSIPRNGKKVGGNARADKNHYVWREKSSIVDKV